MQEEAKDFFLDLPAILERFSKVFGCRTDADIANVLGLTRQAVANWRAAGKGNMDKVITACAKHGKSLDFILTGINPAQSETDLESAITRIRNAGGTVSFPPKQ